MVLTPHALAGTAAAMVFRHHPVLAFCAGFISHFLIDAIPHWHYPLQSLEKNLESPLDSRIVFDRRLIHDCILIGIDFGIGVGISLIATYVLFPQYLLVAFLGAIGGIIPDFLQFLYYIFRDSPLLYLQRLHVWIHAKKRLDSTPVSGVAYQLAFSALCIFILRSF